MPDGFEMAKLVLAPLASATRPCGLAEARSSVNDIWLHAGPGLRVEAMKAMIVQAANFMGVFRDPTEISAFFAELAEEWAEKEV